MKTLKLSYAILCKSCSRINSPLPANKIKKGIGLMTYPFARAYKNSKQSKLSAPL